MNFRATSPAFMGSHLANPKQDNGDLRKTLKGKLDPLLIAVALNQGN